MSIIKDYLSVYNLMINLNPENYIDKVFQSIEIVENKLQNTVLDVETKDKNNFIEKELNPPSLIVIFYYYIYYYKSIPTQQQYISLYHYINEEWISNNIPKKHTNAFDGRLSRTYSSLIRDVHCYLLLKHSNQFKKVKYDIVYDLNGKVDILVQSQRNYWYGLQLRLKSRNSDLFYLKKPYRNAYELEMVNEIIDMPLKFKEAKIIPTKKTIFMYTVIGISNG